MHKVLIALVVVAALLAPASAVAQGDKPFNRLCLVEVRDGPGLLPRQAGVIFRATYASHFPNAPHFLARSGGEHWTIDAEHRRQRVDTADFSIFGHLAQDAVSGHTLLVNDHGLAFLGPDGRFSAVRGNNPRELNRTRSMLSSASMGATFLVTDDGVFRYSPTTGASLVASTAGLRTRYNSASASLPKMARIAFAYDSGLYLLDPAGMVERVPSIENPVDNPIIEIAENADGSGIIVIARRSGYAVSLALDGRLTTRTVLQAPSYSRIDFDWNKAVEAYAPLGQPWRSAIEKLVKLATSRVNWDGNHILQDKIIIHPTAKLALKLSAFPNPTVIENAPGWIDIGGIAQLNDQPVDDVVALPHRDAILVGAGPKLFLILDKARSSGAACNIPVRAEETSQAFCTRPMGQIEGDLVDGIEPDEIWQVKRDGQLTVLGNSERTFKPTIARFAPVRRSNSTLIVMPWRREMLGILGLHEHDVELFSLDGLTRRVENQPIGPDLKRFNYEVVAVAPDLEVVLLRTDGRLFALIGRDNALTAIEPPAGVSLGEVVVMGRSVLISAFGPFEQPGAVYGFRLRPGLLFRLDERGNLSQIEIPSIAGQGATSYRSFGGVVQGMRAWPSRNGILLSLNGMPYLWSNDHLQRITISGEPPFVASYQYGVLLDRGPDKPAFLSDHNSIWSIDETRGARQIWRVPQGSKTTRILFDHDPATGGALLETPDGLARLDDTGRLEPLPGVRKSETGTISDIKSVPLLRAAFVKTAFGYRVLDDDGILRRIDRLPRRGEGAVRIWNRQRRTLYSGGQTVEIVRRDPSDPPCGG